MFIFVLPITTISRWDRLSSSVKGGVLLPLAFLALTRMSSLHSLCQALVLSWPSAEPSQFANLPKTFSAGLPSIPLDHIFQSQHVCSISPARLIQQLPSLQQGIPQLLRLRLPGGSFDGSANLSSPTLWFPPYTVALQIDTTVCAATEQTGSRDGFSRWHSHAGLLAGAVHWQGGVAWSESCFNPAEGSTAKHETTAHSSSLTSDPKNLQPSCWIWRFRKFSKPYLWTLSSLLILSQGPKRGTPDNSF